MNGSPEFIIPASVASVAIVGTGSRFAVRRIYCVGRNYLEHIREMKEGDERDLPFFFQKPADALVEDNGTVPYPPQTNDLQFEVELVIAIGKAGRDIPLEAAADHVFGYGVGIDMTRRDLQRECRDRQLPWEAGKSFDHSAPCSAMLPATRVAQLAEAAIALTVNGQPRQTGRISDMIWSPLEIISNLSRSYALQAGDLIFTGTPAGVGPVVVGDKVVGTIDGVGSITVTIGPEET